MKLKEKIRKWLLAKLNPVGERLPPYHEIYDIRENQVEVNIPYDPDPNIFVSRMNAGKEEITRLLFKEFSSVFQQDYIRLLQTQSQSQSKQGIKLRISYPILVRRK